MKPVSSGYDDERGDKTDWVETVNTLAARRFLGNGQLAAVLGSAWLLAGPSSASSQSNVATISIQADQPGAQISSNLFGIFFEEINYAGEGGLYGELVRNRAFEEPVKTNGWRFISSGSASGTFTAVGSAGLNTNNPNSARLTFTSGTGSVGMANSGYWGMNFQVSQTYDLSLYARCTNGFAGALAARLENATGSKVYAQGTITNLTTNWQRFSLTLEPGLSDVTGRLAIAISQPGTVWMDVVSLFPRTTFSNRTNGLRSDLATMLANLNPAFLRYPGGNFIESFNVTNAVRWKKTIGDVAQRPGHLNDAWGYWSSDGFGLLEFFQFCEDTGMEPLYGINCGLMLNYNGSANNTVPTNQMGPWVQDALDLIEYANGGTNTTWGSQRAAAGHPAPFNLKYIEIGNENGGSYYNDRYALFYDAITNQYPDMHIIACNWGGLPTSRPVQISDEHYYNNPNFFIANANKYDSYSRAGPKIFVGEYAVTSGYGTLGNLAAALGEAAFMTGMERNADVVQLAAYAPLLANINSIQWHPDLIYYDSSRVCGTPSYYVQKLFAQNQGDVVLPITVTTTGGTNSPHGAIGLGAWNTQVQYTNVVVTSNGVTIYQSDFASGSAGWLVYNGTWTTSGGLYQQTANAIDCRSTTGNTAWSNYTITLRARKTGGSEGFLILFNWLDDNNWTWWNLGGWGNTLHGIEQSVNGAKTLLDTQSAGSIQLNQWYDIRIELSGTRIQCYLDNVLVHDVSYPGSSHKGAIGLGTWLTSSSFTNVVVSNAVQTLFQSDFSTAAGWTAYQGSWSVSGGVYRQTSTTTTDCRSIAGNTSWSDYTLSLKARKEGGSEGFLIIFDWQDNNNFTWWNLGGWGNTQHAIEYSEGGVRSILGNAVSGQIQTGVWYDIRIELSGSRIRCYLNNVLIHDVNYPTLSPLLASASFDEDSGQIIVKAVNVTDSSIPTTLGFQGLTSIAPQAGMTLLTSVSASDENSLTQPTNVVPVGGSIANAGTNFVHTFPANSLTVLRLQTPPTVPSVVKLDVNTNLNDLTSLPNGVPVRLSSFITNSVSVSYTIESAGGSLLTNGTLQILPGNLTGLINVQTNAVLPGTLIRITLHDPVNCVLSGVTRGYLVQPSPSEPLQLRIARFADENLLYWIHEATSLQETTNLFLGWTDITNALNPFGLHFTGQKGFYRLRQ